MSTCKGYTPQNTASQRDNATLLNVLKLQVTQGITAVVSPFFAQFVGFLLRELHVSTGGARGFHSSATVVPPSKIRVLTSARQIGNQTQLHASPSPQPRVEVSGSIASTIARRGTKVHRGCFTVRKRCGMCLLEYGRLLPKWLATCIAAVTHDIYLRFYSAPVWPFTTNLRAHALRIFLCGYGVS